MNTMRHRLLRPVAAAAVGLFGIAGIIGSGGGGGGGGGESGGSNTPSPALLSISSDNALDVSSALVQAVLLGSDAVDDSSSQLGVEQAPQVAMLREPGDDTSDATQAGGSLDIVRKIELAIGPVTEPCESGNGTVTVSGDVAALGTLSVDDEFNLEFDQCDDNIGVILDGNLDFVVDDVQGDPLTEVFLLSLGTTFTDLVATGADRAYSVNGDANSTLDSLGFPVTSSTLSGSTLEIASGIEIYTYTNFTQTLSRNTTTGEIELTASGTLDSDLLGGSVDYETVESILAIGNENPSSGVILITGADDTTVRIVIENTTSVRLEIDSDGDGNVDDTQFTTWEELTGAVSSIDSANAQEVAREVLAAAVQFPGSVASLQFFTGNPFENLRQLGPSGNFDGQVIACTDGGDATISGFIANAGTYTAGDQLSAIFSACVRDPSGSPVDSGQLDVQIDSYQSAPLVQSGSATFIGLERTVDGNTVTSLGTLDQSVEIIGGATLEFDSSAMAFVLIDGLVLRGLSNVQSNSLIDISVPAPRPLTLNYSGTLATTALPGTFDYSVVVPIVSVLDDDPATGPTAGETLITADDDSTVTIVAVDNLNARLDVDLDGDTTIDDQIDVLWADILP
jgi:hypothetical protein